MQSPLSEVLSAQKHIKQKSPSNFSHPPRSLGRSEFYGCQCVFYFTRINVIMYLKPGTLFPLGSPRKLLILGMNIEIFIQAHEIIRWHSVIYSNHLGNIFKRETSSHL